MVNVFLIIELVLFILLLETKKAVISVFLFIISGTGFILEIFEMKDASHYNKVQLTRGGCILFVELLLVLDYFFHFVNFFE